MDGTRCVGNATCSACAPSGDPLPSWTLTIDEAGGVRVVDTSCAPALVSVGSIGGGGGGGGGVYLYVGATVPFPVPEGAAQGFRWIAATPAAGVTASVLSEGAFVGALSCTLPPTPAAAFARHLVFLALDGHTAAARSGGVSVLTYATATATAMAPSADGVDGGSPMSLQGGLTLDVQAQWPGLRPAPVVRFLAPPAGGGRAFDVAAALQGSGAAAVVAARTPRVVVAGDAAGAAGVYPVALSLNGGTQFVVQTGLSMYFAVPELCSAVSDDMQVRACACRYAFPHARPHATYANPNIAAVRCRTICRFARACWRGAAVA